MNNEQTNENIFMQWDRLFSKQFADGSDYDTQ